MKTRTPASHLRLILNAVAVFVVKDEAKDGAVADACRVAGRREQILESVHDLARLGIFIDDAGCRRRGCPTGGGATVMENVFGVPVGTTSS